MFFLKGHEQKACALVNHQCALWVCRAWDEGATSASTAILEICSKVRPLHMLNARKKFICMLLYEMQNKFRAKRHTMIKNLSKVNPNKFCKKVIVMPFLSRAQIITAKVKIKGTSIYLLKI